jgi:hypothetical protein
MPGIRKLLNPNPLSRPRHAPRNHADRHITAPDAVEKLKNAFKGAFRKRFGSKKPAEATPATAETPTATEPAPAAAPEATAAPVAAEEPKTETPAPVAAAPVEAAAPAPSTLYSLGNGVNVH